MVATGQVYIGSGGYGGLVSATPIKSDVTWPCAEEPDIVSAVVVAAAAEAELVDAGATAS